MKVERVNAMRYVLEFDNEERIYLEQEAKDNETTVVDVISMLLGMLFIAGYSKIIGKD